jgi:hypothetical protein
MARRKPDKAGEVERPITADSSAKMLEVYAGMILDLTDRSAAQETTGPGWLSRTETIDLTLTPDDRTILLGLPEQVEPLKGRLDIAADGDESIQITPEELAGMLLALSHGISEAEGRDALKLMQMAAKAASCFSDHLSKQAPVRRRKAAAKEARPTKGQEAVYQLKIKLKDIRPPVWRRVMVSDCLLTKLHEVIQIVMGWTDSHMHQFVVNGTYYGPASPDDFGFGMDMEVEDEEGVLLSEILKGDRKVRFEYDYDFGAGWQHDIEFERVVEREPKAKYPRCVEGARACPPEDVGGPWGSADFLEAISGPKHPDHRDIKGWVGGKFDPEKFSLDKLNKELRQSS